MINKKIIIRYLIFLGGLFLGGIGIALTIKSGIGSTPMSVIPLVLSNVLPLSFGQMNFIWSLSFVLVQILLLGKKFKKEQYFQFLVCPLIGFFIDFGLDIFKNIVLYSYVEQLLVLIIACIILALGIYMQVLANVIINPGEGIVKAIAQKTKIKFGNVKIYFDMTVMTIGIILSIILLHKVIGVGEGTLISALATGAIVKGFKWMFEHLDLERLYEN